MLVGFDEQKDFPTSKSKSWSRYIRFAIKELLLFHPNTTLQISTQAIIFSFFTIKYNINMIKRRGLTFKSSLMISMFEQEKIFIILV